MSDWQSVQGVTSRTGYGLQTVTALNKGPGRPRPTGKRPKKPSVVPGTTHGASRAACGVRRGTCVALSVSCDALKTSESPAALARAAGLAKQASRTLSKQPTGPRLTRKS